MTLICRDMFVALAAVEFESMVEFYTQLFDQAPATLIPKTYAEFRLLGLKLGVFKPQSSHEQEFSNATQAGMSLCLEVEDLDGAIAHLAQLGYPPPGRLSVASHGREIYAYDPAGNRLMLHQSA